MEIKLNLKLETIFAMIHFLEHMDMETFALIAVAVMMIPFFIYSLWSLTFALVCQLFWLGVKAGVVLMTVCSMILTVLKCSQWSPAAGARAFGIAAIAQGEGGGLKCTFLDVILTVLFQAGVRVPSGLWNGLMDNFVKGSGVGQGAVKGSSKITKKKGPTRRGNRKVVGSSSSGQTGQSEEEEMSTEDNLDGLPMDVFEDVGASGDHVPPSSAEEQIIKGILLDEEFSSSDAATCSSVNGETGGTRRKTRGGKKRTKINNN